MSRLFRNLILLFAVLLQGGLGGLFCGFLIISFGFYIGRSGTTGTEYFGFWDPSYAWFGAKEDRAPVGAVVFPIGYYLFLRSTKILRALFQTTMGTFAGGFIGALVGPPLALISGCVGFFLSCHFVSRPERASMRRCQAWECKAIRDAYF